MPRLTKEELGSIHLMIVATEVPGNRELRSTCNPAETNDCDLVQAMLLEDILEESQSTDTEGESPPGKTA